MRKHEDLASLDHQAVRHSKRFRVEIQSLEKHVGTRIEAKLGPGGQGRIPDPGDIFIKHQFRVSTLGSLDLAVFSVESKVRTAPARSPWLGGIRSEAIPAAAA